MVNGPNRSLNKQECFSKAPHEHPVKPIPVRPVPSQLKGLTCFEGLGIGRALLLFCSICFGMMSDK